MICVFHPSFRGRHTVESLAEDFIGRFAARVRSGPFPAGSARRNQYNIVEQSSDALHFRSGNLLTGINVGLNDVRIHVNATTREISYDVSYWTWATYTLSLCLGIAGVLVLAFVLSDAYSGVPPSTKRIMMLTMPPMALFWGIIWPWLLIALHKRPAARCLTRLFDEVNTTSP